MTERPQGIFSERFTSYISTVLAVRLTLFTSACLPTPAIEDISGGHYVVEPGGFYEMSQPLGGCRLATAGMH